MENYVITMAHGDGGEQTHQLIKEVFVAGFASEDHTKLDAAIVPWHNKELVVSTDSFVVSPLFFAGGNIGKLAVCGTCNDVAVSGGTPLYLTCGFLIEEGFLRTDLVKIVTSMREEAEKIGVQIVAGDTKVVEKGSIDGLFINTTGFGCLTTDKNKPFTEIEKNDVVLISGTIGDHGVAILSARGELGISSTVRSDCASLVSLIKQLQSELKTIRIMRDPTRGGLATSLVEIAEDFAVDILLKEEAIPVCDEVHGVCDIIGYDPLFMANEGKLIIIVSHDEEKRALEIMRNFAIAKEAVTIGYIENVHVKGKLLIETPLGSKRRLTRLASSMLPRIC